MIFANRKLTYYIWLLINAAHLFVNAVMYVGDACDVQSHKGICKPASECPELEQNMKDFRLTRRDVVRCGYTVYEEVICCPEIVGKNRLRASDRPAVRACEEIEKYLQPSLITHILGGTPVELGEYPHMAAVGLHSNISNETIFDCGGTLIDKRFVLTAAHCLMLRDRVPTIVRLGVTNFTDPNEMRDAIEINVKNTHIHPEYVYGKKYNDIGLIELERDVNWHQNPNVFPTCLYTNTEDPSDDAVLYVTGWGVVDTKTRAKSNVLLKAQQKITPLERCNASFIAEGLTRHIIDGIQSTQLCAHDPGLTKDACQGDSGGPLNLVVDQKLNKYRVVGIITAGFSCATTTPGLYTRVASYLDYIEGVVWPNDVVEL